MRLYAVSFTRRLDEDLFRRLLKVIDESKRERIGRFRRWEDAHRVLLADLLLRRVLTAETGISNEALLFETDEYGKPRLLNDCNIHFNLSHSGAWVVCALDERPIGVDVEKNRDISLDVSSLCLTAGEITDMEKKGDSEKLTFFYSLWTLKESYVKAIGKGLSTSLTSFAVRFLPEGGIRVASGGRTVDGIFLKAYNIDEGYSVSVCAHGDDFPQAFRIWRIEEILHRSS